MQQPRQHQQLLQHQPRQHQQQLLHQQQLRQAQQALSAYPHLCLAAVGQAVKKGDVILVLEAMKMENDIVAPQDGTIASINASTGDSVESGAVLATLN